MPEVNPLVERFEEQRAHLRAVAYRMLGSLSEADDAVQETWLRLSRSDISEVENLPGWLTTVCARVCLNLLRSRKTRREDALDWHLPDPIVSPEDLDPEREVELADSVGIALLVVLETLSPAERLAFVLHDLFAIPFDEIAGIVDRTPTATRQLASRARRRVQGAAPPAPDHDRARQRQIVDAFFAAARGGDFEALVSLLDPDIVLRSDRGDLPGSQVVRGAEQVAANAIMFASPHSRLRPVLVNGTAGVVVTVNDLPLAVIGFTVANGKVVAIDALGDLARLQHLAL